MSEQKFAVMIRRAVDDDTGKTSIEMKTKGEGISLAEAAIILEGWAEKVKYEIKKPYIDNMQFKKD